MQKLFIFILVITIVFSLDTNTTNSTTTNTSNVSSVVSNTSVSNSSCNGEFYSLSKFQTWGLKRPSYLSQAAISSNLTYCKMFNNVSSCCDSTTDLEISEYYNLYKGGLANITGQRMKKMKTTFDQYKNISVDSSLTNMTNLTQTITNLTNDIKNRWILINQQIVSCAQASLKLSVGLLCTGCSANYSTNQQNGKIVLNRGACVALANSCYKLILSLNEAQNASRDDCMNLTDAITGFIGDSVSVDANSTSNTSALFGDVSDVNFTSNFTGRLLADTNGSQNGSNGTLINGSNETMNHNDSMHNGSMNDSMSQNDSMHNGSMNDSMSQNDSMHNGSMNDSV